MKPEIDALLKFPIFKDFRPDELAAVARHLKTHELDIGAVLFEEGDPGDAMYFLYLGRIQIDRQTTPGNYEVLAELDPPTILGEMAVLESKPRSARAVAMKPSVLWAMSAEALAELAGTGNASAYKVMRWIARGLSDRLRHTNDKLIEIYAKPFKSIMELKERIKELHPGVISVGMDKIQG